MEEEEGERTIHWTSALEMLLAEEAEKCRGYAWIHSKGEVVYGKYESWISLPVIILSSVGGFLTASTGSILPGGTISNGFLGAVSLFVAILNTIGTKYQFAKKNEGHRVAYLAYNEIFNFVTTELSLPRNERMKPYDMIKMVRTTMKGLAQTAPSLPPNIIDIFHRQFAHQTHISQPPETNGLTKVKVYTENATAPTPTLMSTPRVTVRLE